jgi:hypothetical protein
MWVDAKDFGLLYQMPRRRDAGHADQLTAVGVSLAGSAGYVRLNHHKSGASFRMTLSFSEGHRPAQPAVGDVGRASPMVLPHPGNRGPSCVLIPRGPCTERQKTMIREMLGIAEGILQDLHNDHGEVDSLMDRIMESEDGAQREALFEEMKTKLLAHAHAEQEVLYRRLEASQSEASRSFAHEGTNEHQIVERQLQKLSADRDKTSEQWTAELKVLCELVEHHVEEEESTGFSCARQDFDKDELDAMAQDFQTRKAQLMTRVAD